MGNTEVQVTIEMIIRLELQKEDICNQIDALKDKLKAEMTAQSVEQLRAGLHQVSWTTYKSRRFDTTAFKAEHAELYDEFSKVTETKRFTLK